MREGIVWSALGDLTTLVHYALWDRSPSMLDCHFDLLELVRRSSTWTCQFLVQDSSDLQFCVVQNIRFSRIRNQLLSISQSNWLFAQTIPTVRHRTCAWRMILLHLHIIRELHMSGTSLAGLQSKCLWSEHSTWCLGRSQCSILKEQDRIRHYQLQK